MLSRMLNCPVIYFHNYDVDGMFGHGGYLWFLKLNCLKGLDELPSGMVFCLILSPRCEFLSSEPRFERAAIGGSMGSLLTE